MKRRKKRPINFQATGTFKYDDKLFLRFDDVNIKELVRNVDLACKKEGFDMLRYLKKLL